MNTPTSEPPVRRVDPLVAYYLSTPVFALADLALGWDVRAGGIEDPAYRGLYYGVAFGVGLVCRTRPGVTPWAAMMESAVNLLTLLLSVLLPIWSAPLAALEGGPLPEALGVRELINTFIAGLVLVAAFHRRQREAMGRLEGGW